jgi:hypothetical protein
VKVLDSNSGVCSLLHQMACIPVHQNTENTHHLTEGHQFLVRNEGLQCINYTKLYVNNSKKLKLRPR